MYVLFATKAGIDLAAYFLPANATIYPPYESLESPKFKRLGVRFYIIIGTLNLYKENVRNTTQK